MGWSECKNVVSGDICGCQQFEALSRNPFACGSCDCHKHFHVRPEDDEFTQNGSCTKIRNVSKCGCQKFLASSKDPAQCSCCSHPRFLHLKDQLEEERARALKRVKLDITVQSISNAEDEQSCITKTRSSKPPNLEIVAAKAFTGTKAESYKCKIRDHLNTTMTRFQLNEDQACVLLNVERWFSSYGMMPVHLMPELCLVHGTFGSGKSYLLVILVIFVVDILQILNDTTTRILISAATDSAVDRILKDLLAHGFHEFMRVGSYEKIAEQILRGFHQVHENLASMSSVTNDYVNVVTVVKRYSVHLTRHNDYNYSETIQELEQLIKTAGCSRRLQLEEELNSIRDGGMKKRQEKLNSVRVVGVTCQSCTKPVLEGQNFKICFVDECSQIPEPLALLPVKNCTKLVVVGDLAQLPSFLSCVGPPRHEELIKVAGQSPLYNLGLRRSISEYKESEEENMLVGSKRIFSCLIAEGHQPIILNKQYRCHPRLTTLPSLLFYRGEVENGCRDGDREPLLQGLPPLLFCETGSNGVEEKDGSFGFMNKHEAQLVSEIIKSLIAHGISCSRVGVITFYKAQASLVKQTLVADSALADLQVATVDAYEGTEKDIIILSCCRTNGVGSVASPKQLNVALTRARHHLIIVGMGKNLQKNELWKKIMGSVRSTPGSFKPAAIFMTEIRVSPVAETNFTAPQLEVVSSGGKSSSDFRSSDERDDYSDEEALNKKALKSSNNQLEMGLLIEDHLCTKGLESAFGAVDFSVQDFWEGYKFYCFGYYSHSEKYKKRFLASKMGSLISHVHKERSTLAGAKFDETVRLVWSMMEDYLKIRHGKDCTNLRSLVEEFEDIDKLSATENGLSLLQLIKDDEYSTERLYKNKHVHLDSTNIFEQLRQRLNQVDTNLEDLKKTSGLQNESAMSHIPDPTDRRQGEIARSKRVRPPPEMKKRSLKQSIRSGSSSRPTTGSRAITYSESEGSSQPSFSLRF